MKIALLLALYCACLSAQAQRRGVFYDLGAAIQEPNKVRVLDLRGQNLDSLPRSVQNFQNIEAILIGMKLRNLWLYPRSWKYELHLKRLPAGGYLHLQGRGAGGQYYFFNNFKNQPLDFCQFPKLRVLGISGGVPFAMADTIATRMSMCRPKVIVLGGSVRSKNTDSGVSFLSSLDKYSEAKDYLRSFKIKLH